MYGYVRPLKGELKVREFEQFKAAYCGLCHTLKKRCGLAARFLINYDFTFLFMLLFDKGETPEYGYSRCIASPCRKKRYCVAAKSSELCADCSMILAYYKICDSVKDEAFFKKAAGLIALLFLKRPHAKAAKRCPGFEAAVSARLRGLAELESEKTPSMDRAADQFALLMQAIPADEENSAAMQQLLYQLGRWIYLIDAYDDLEDDLRSGNYNPLAERFSLVGTSLSAEDKEYFKVTLSHSINLIASAYALLPENSWAPILKNVIYLGIPAVNEQVLSGIKIKDLKRSKTDE